MATLNAATARVADAFSANGTGLDQGQRAGLIIGLVVITAASNLIGVRWYGRIERVVAAFKLLLVVLLFVLCICIVFGAGGPSMAGPEGQLLEINSNFTRYGVTPGFRPDGFRSLTEWAIDTRNGTLAHEYGIPGSHGGRLFAILTAIALAMFSCMGGDQVRGTICILGRCGDLSDSNTFAGDYDCWRSERPLERLARRHPIHLLHTSYRLSAPCPRGWFHHQLCGSATVPDVGRG